MTNDPLAETLRELETKAREHTGAVMEPSDAWVLLIDWLNPDGSYWLQRYEIPIGEGSGEAAEVAEAVDKALAQLTNAAHNIGDYRRIRSLDVTRRRHLVRVDVRPKAVPTWERTRG